jgi:protein-disulfide isomerase
MPHNSATSRALRVVLAAALAVVVFVVALLATGGPRSSPPPKPGSVKALNSAQAIGALLAGIPQRNNVLGKVSAPVTLRWFGDMQCPFCKEFTLGALPSIIQKWVRGGQLKIEYRSIETATRQPSVFKTQEIAALAAGAQHKMWYFLETFYHEQGEEDSGYVTEKYLRGIARQVRGLNLTVWAADRHNPQFVEQLAEDLVIARSAGFTGTPSFLIGRSGDAAKRFVPGSLVNPEPFNRAIEYLLRVGKPAVPQAIPATLKQSEPVRTVWREIATSLEVNTAR